MLKWFEGKKTIIFNTLVLVSQYVPSLNFLPPKYAVPIVAVANALLRLVTKGPVTILP